MKLFVAALLLCLSYPVTYLSSFQTHKIFNINTYETTNQPEAPKSSLLTQAEIADLIHNAAQKNNVPAEFVKSIVAVESGFQSNAVSPKGAVGLMQVMPETASQMGLDAAIPAQNVEAGTRYLATLIHRYQKNTRNWLKHAIAAYNAGPGNVDHYHGVPPFRETRNYVTRVLGFFISYGGSMRSFMAAQS